MKSSVATLALVSVLGLTALSVPGCKDAAQAEPFRDITLERIAQFGPAADLPEPPGVDAETTRAVRDLAATRAQATGDLRNAPLVEIAGFGDRAAAPLTGLAADVEADEAERLAACELLGVIGTPVAAARLIHLVDQLPEAWLRRRAILDLGLTNQDRCVPELVGRLRYEKDAECVVWTAVALARFSNYSALQTVQDMAKNGGPLATIAATQLDAIEAELGRSTDEIIELWNGPPNQGLRVHEPSDALRGALWRLVPDFSGETFQLRPVDDSRFTLSRLGPWAAREIAAALNDTDPYIRLHGSQVLERMGQRASEAAPALLAILADPIAGPAAAEALGRVGDPSVESGLIEAAQPTQSFELRNAATRALGRLGLESSLPTLVEVYDEAVTKNLPGLRMTAATARVLLHDGDAVARYLVERLDGQLDATEAEVALATWLTQGATQGKTAFQAALGAWNVLAPRPGEIPDTAKARDRRDRRAQLMRGRIDALLD